MRSLPRSLIPAALFVALVGSCTKDEDTTPDDTSTDGACTSGANRCTGDLWEVCLGGAWEFGSVCEEGCSEVYGCVECVPEENFGLACFADAVYTCESNGTVGTLVEQCDEDLECRDGQCVAACTADGVDLIYVVDRTYRLISFDPRKLDTTDDPFQLVGQLACDPNFGNVPGWGGGQVTPFSMSVDRTGTAWVLYTSGEIFHVDIADASCQSSGFPRLQPGTQGTWSLFGMGFVTDDVGGDEEKLWVGGGQPNPTPGGMLGYVDPDTLAITTTGSLPTNVENSPEFTGTGNAELFAYFPGFTSTVRQLDKNSGNPIGPVIDAGSVSGVQAWAFAHWGGKFYIFVTDASGNSTVKQADRVTGQFEGTVRENLPYVIVGAGVSTCAPTIGGG